MREEQINIQSRNHMKMLLIFFVLFLEHTIERSRICLRMQKSIKSEDEQAHATNTQEVIFLIQERFNMYELPMIWRQLIRFSSTYSVMLSSTKEEMDYMEEKQNIDSITETLLLYMYFLYQKHEIPYLHFAIKRAVTIFMARFECLKYVYSGSCS